MSYFVKSLVEMFAIEFEVLAEELRSSSAQELYRFIYKKTYTINTIYHTYTV